MFWRRLSIFLTCLIALIIPVEHKYDKLFRFFSLRLIPDHIVLPAFFEKKIYFYPSDVIALILLFIALFALKTPVRQFFGSKGAWFLWTIFFLTVLSIVFSPLSGYPIPYIRCLQLATPFILYCFLANASMGKAHLTTCIFQCMILTACVQAVIAILQFAMQGSLGFRILGEQSGFPSFGMPAGHFWLFDFQEKAGSFSVIRSSGTMPHSNVLGGFLAGSILASYSSFTNAGIRFFCILLQFFAMCLTFSRSALFAWALGTVVWLILAKAQNRKGFILTILCITAISGTILYRPIIHRGGIINYNSLAKNSDALRIRYQNVALKMIKDHPFLGVGFHQLSICAKKYVADDPAYPANGGTHNIYLYLAAETGLISLAAFFGFICFMLYQIIQSSLSLQMASLISIFAAFLFIGGCDFYPLLFQQGKLPLFLVFGLLSCEHSHTKGLHELKC